MKHIKHLAPPAETSLKERSKIDRRNAKKFKSPDVNKMYSLQVDYRTTCYFYTKDKYDRARQRLAHAEAILAMGL